jgi:hypothetical protein
VQDSKRKLSPCSSETSSTSISHARAVSQARCQPHRLPSRKKVKANACAFTVREMENALRAGPATK